jgi:hypothetical protein
VSTRHARSALLAGCVAAAVAAGVAASVASAAATTSPPSGTQPADARRADPEVATMSAAQELQANASATDAELQRLARARAADAARRATDDATIRSAPGRPVAEVGGLRRCVDATGQAVFTDRRCDSVDAIDSPPVLPRIRPPASAIPIRGCARTRRDLLEGVRHALEMRDPNRFSGFYDWTGMDGTQGYRLLDRLEALTKRPFIDARLVSSRAPPVNDDEGGFGLLSRPFFGDPRPEPAAPPPPADLLRIDQMRSATDGASQVTYFRLRANAGCWWLAY